MEFSIVSHICYYQSTNRLLKPGSGYLFKFRPIRTAVCFCMERLVRQIIYRFAACRNTDLWNVQLNKFPRNESSEGPFIQFYSICLAMSCIADMLVHFLMQLSTIHHISSQTELNFITTPELIILQQDEVQQRNSRQRIGLCIGAETELTLLDLNFLSNFQIEQWFKKYLLIKQICLLYMCFTILL